jgi:deoxyhypusine synthase
VAKSNEDHPMGLASAIQRARRAEPLPIRGGESPRELLSSAFPAFVGRQVRQAFQLMDGCATEGHTVFLTMSGAMTPAGLHRSCIVPLVQAGLVHVITTTGANLYHDAHRVLGHRIHEIRPDVGDRALREARVIRIYDLAFDERVLLDTDLLFATLLRAECFQRSMTTAEVHLELGRMLAHIEDELGLEQPCLLSACYRAGVPVFVGAPQDGSIFLNLVKLSALLGDAFRCRLDIARDVLDMAALQWMVQRAGPTAIWILGGGVPKNYTLQGEPTLSQIFGLEARGFDVDVQFCVDPVDNGALSSCPAGEGHTWGKVSAECVDSSSVYVHTDVTGVFPFLVHALMSAGVRREPRRLADQIPLARETLMRALEERRAELLDELARPLRTADGKPLPPTP